MAAILNGDTHLKYDVPFVFAAVNADCIDWLVREQIRRPIPGGVQCLSPSSLMPACPHR